MSDFMEYMELYEIAMEVYDEVLSDLNKLPTWVLDDTISDHGEGYIDGLLYDEGWYVVGYDGKPPTLIEWLNFGYYDTFYENNTQALLNDYISDLNCYIDIMSDQDVLNRFNRPLLASYGISNTQGINVYDVIHGIDDYIAIGFTFKGSQLYFIKYDCGNPYVTFGDTILYLNEFIRIEKGI